MRRHVLPGEKLSAAVVVLDRAVSPADLAAPMLVHALLRVGAL
ncbi:hypothetical protein [Arthrobacter antioxidans]|nr:hypothetical protein [Arthrobacter antioxidans]